MKRSGARGKKRKGSGESVDAGARYEAMKWKKVEVPESFLAGCEEAGFMGLEEVDEVDADQVMEMTARKKRRRATAKSTATATAKHEDDEEEKEEGGKEESDEEEEEESGDEEENAEIRRLVKGSERILKDDEVPRRKKPKQETKPQKPKPKPVAKPAPEKEEEAEEEEKADDIVDDWSVLKLHRKALAGIRKLGFARPTPIQRAAIPAAITAGKDIIGAAETGSGKTLAYAIPIVHTILELRDSKRKSKLKGDGDDDDDDEKRHMLALILTPTRELALQVRDHIKAFAGEAGVHVAAIVGGMSQEKQERILAQGPEIVVATTGRLWELISKSGNEFLSDFSRLMFFVLDEADRMIEVGHFRELDGIADLIRAGNTSKLHTFIFSATLSVTLTRPGKPESASTSRKQKKDAAPKTPLDRVLEKVEFRRKVETIDLTTEAVTVGTLKEYKLLCTDEEKDTYLVFFLLSHRPGRTVVFANSIAVVRHIVALLHRLRICCARVHSGMQQRQRIKSLEHFRSHDTCVLVASDVAARGLDIPEVAYVVHYHVPKSTDLYVHRAGRTARAGKDGCSFALVNPAEVKAFGDICRELNKEIPVLPTKVPSPPAAATTSAVTTAIAAEKRVPDVTRLRPVVAVAKRLNRELRIAAVDAAKKKWLRSMAKQLDVQLDDDEVDDMESQRKPKKNREDDDGGGDDENGGDNEDAEVQENEDENEEDTAARMKAMNEWQMKVTSLKEKLLGMLLDLDSDGSSSRKGGFGSRAMPSGSGMTIDKLDAAIQEARSRRTQLENFRRKHAKKIKAAAAASNRDGDRDAEGDFGGQSTSKKQQKKKSAKRHRRH